jgi:cytochrome c oxidase subunit 3
MIKQYQPFHLVDISPWPIMVSLGSLMLTSGLVMWMHSYVGGSVIALLGFIVILVVLLNWWKDVIREATYGGYHTDLVQRGIRMGMILFIISEVFFFLAFFWAFFHSALTPNIELGSIWPPKGIIALNPWEVPLLNTLILLTSGATATWAHHGLVSGNRKETIIGLSITVVLGIIFTSFQIMEYIEAPFTIADGVYGSTFYGATGLHGVHVIIGTLFILVGLIRVLNYHFTKRLHLGLELSLWYWHFVDVVWIFLFLSIYYWGC